ncbi:helix-turn-helix domain-containing protein [Taibaiella koreensis]|uniref:helix-turn-helix domain-containing protein n=1 Tax=Taibaiella koreensis TaxID=1268548 RepID=UPI000E59E443|nr:AraC family transcriptional regulator [Taibaiella koreensis]
MPVSVYDSNGQQYSFGDGSFSAGIINQPLVTESRVKYSFPFGDAELVQIAFSGIYIVYGDIMMQEAKVLHFSMAEEIDLVELHFTLAGSGSLYNEASGSTYNFRQNEYNMHYIPHFEGTGNYRKDQKYQFFEVHFTKKFFTELAQDSSPMLMEFAGKLAASDLTELVTPSLPMTFAMHQCIREIMGCNQKGGLKLLFLQSKSIELLTLQAQAFEEYHDRNPGACKTEYDKERIHYAREYLLLHAAEPPSLTELARVAGLNEFKLKNGFREIFNNSVFGYLNEYRLQGAREMLLAGGAIKTVADHFGFSSVQHFSKAFRQQFGLPPGQCRTT